jgi:thymidine kinase
MQLNNIMQMNKSFESGYLEIIAGPMYSGKTSKILDIYKQCKFCNIDVMVINHSLDVRYDNQLLSTHDKNMIPCFQLDKLSILFNDYDNDSLINIEIIKTKLVYIKSKVILINEAQFFPDLELNIKNMLKEKKQVYVAGLDGSYVS